MNKAIVVKLNPTKMHSMATKSISHIIKYTQRMMEAVVFAVDIRNGFEQFGKHRNLNNITVVKLNPTEMHPWSPSTFQSKIKYTHYRG